MSPLLQTPLTVEHALLGFVRHEPLHGYEINRRLRETPELRLVWRMKQSRLYALLSRLEDEGLLDATLEPQDGRPPRKVYDLTPSGESAFTHWLTQPVKLPREMRLDFMLKLYFASKEAPEIADLLIQRQQEACAQWLETQADADADADADATHPYIRVVRRYRRGHIEAIRDWLAWLPAGLIREGQPVE